MPRCNDEFILRRKAQGFPTAAALAAATGLNIGIIGAIEGRQYDPFDRRHPEGSRPDWKDSAQCVARALRCLPEDLWPTQHARMERSVASRLANSLAASPAPSPHRTPHDLMEVAQARAWAHQVLRRLPTRTAYVLRQLYFEDRRAADIAREMSMSHTNVTRIELQGLRYIRGVARRDPASPL